MFTQLWDIEHATNSPRYPQSNGQAERAIGTVKNLVKKMLEDGSDVQLAWQSFRNTVREGYSASPAQLLFSRRCRTSPPMQRTMLNPQPLTRYIFLVCATTVTGGSRHVGVDAIKMSHVLVSYVKPVTLQ